MGWEESGGPPRGWEAHPKLYEGLGGPCRDPGGIGRCIRRFRKHTRRCGSSREAHPEVRALSEAHLKVRKGSGVPPGEPEGSTGGLGEVGRTFRWAERCRESHAEVQKVHPEVWVWLGGAPGGPGGDRRPT